MKDIIGQGSVLPKVFGDLNTIRTTTFREDCFLHGNSFSYIEWLSYSASEVKDFIVDPRGFVNPPGGFGRVMAEVPVLSSTSGPVTIAVYGDAQANEDGTIKVFYNRDGRSLKQVANTFIRLNPTVTNPGVNFANYLIPATGVTPSVGTGGSVEDVLPFNLRLDQKYLFRVTNDNGNGVRIGVRAIIYEC